MLWQAESGWGVDAGTLVQAMVTEWDNNSHVLRRAASTIESSLALPKLSRLTRSVGSLGAERQDYRRAMAPMAGRGDGKQDSPALGLVVLQVLRPESENW